MPEFSSPTSSCAPVKADERENVQAGSGGGRGIAPILAMVEFADDIMFLKSSSKAEAKPIAVASGVPSASRIGRDMNVLGDLRGAGTVRIDGEIDGDVFGRSVTVSEGGVVKGSVFAEEAHIAGAVEGRIEAVSITVAKSAVIGGTITHNELEIETGAHIEGRRPWRPLSYLEENRQW